MLMPYSNARPSSTGVVSSITFWISLPVKRTSANGVSSLARRPSTPSACWPRLRPWRAPLERPLGAQDHGSGRTCCQVERTIGKVHRASCVLRTLASAQVRRRSVPLRPLWWRTLPRQRRRSRRPVRRSSRGHAWTDGRILGLRIRYAVQTATARLVLTGDGHLERRGVFMPTMRAIAKALQSESFS